MIIYYISDEILWSLAIILKAYCQLLRSLEAQWRCHLCWLLTIGLFYAHSYGKRVSNERGKVANGRT